jgi:hypothetical protein
MFPGNVSLDGDRYGYWNGKWSFSFTFLIGAARGADLECVV